MPALAEKNAKSIIMDVWLLSLCDHFVYWQTSQAWAVLLKRRNLTASHVGPAIGNDDFEQLVDVYMKNNRPEDHPDENFEEHSRHQISDHLYKLSKTVDEMNE